MIAIKCSSEIIYSNNRETDEYIKKSKFIIKPAVAERASYCTCSRRSRNGS
jgi:hypothetical protein